MAIITYSEKARNELKDIALYIAEQSYGIELALNVICRMRTGVRRRLEVFPYSGQVIATIDGVEYHKIVIERYGFIYKIGLDENNEEVAIVVDVIHEAKEVDNK